MKYAVEMGSGAMIYIPSFIKIGLSIQKVMERWEFGDSQKHRHTDSMEIALTYFHFFKIRKVV
jgi:hypothetical protein